MERRIYRSLLEKAKETRTNGKYEFDLNMKNGDELTITLQGEPITKDYSLKDYLLLTDNDKVIHFNSLGDIAEWIAEKYC